MNGRWLEKEPGTTEGTQSIQAKDRHFLHPWEDVTSIGAEARTAVSKGDGNRLIDGSGGMWCVNVGHGREEIVEAVAALMRNLTSGRVIIPPEGYYRRCHELCRKHDVLFIADEVVTAFDRLGHYFASKDVFGVDADMLTAAKGLTSGYVPMGALFISDRLMADIKAAGNEPKNFFSGFTYSGHPVAAAAALCYARPILRSSFPRMD